MSGEPRHAVLRADGSAALGLGHVMRSLALGEALAARGWRVTLAGSAPLPTVIERAAACRVTVHQLAAVPCGAGDAVETVGLGPDVVIVDGYSFTREFFAELERAEVGLVVIDDNAETNVRTASAVVNQNPHASVSMYRHVGVSQLLLGLDYALLRREIRTAGEVRRAPNDGDPCVFLSMGGSDPAGLTEELAVVLDGLGVPVRVAPGSANPRAHELESALRQLDHVTIVASGSFAAELATSDVAIIGAGSTMWEAAHLGVPAVAVVVADNQRAPSAVTEVLGFVQCVDARGDVDAAYVASIAVGLLGSLRRRAEMSERGQRCVDGKGAERVALALEALVPAHGGVTC